MKVYIQIIEKPNIVNGLLEKDKITDKWEIYTSNHSRYGLEEYIDIDISQHEHYTSNYEKKVMAYHTRITFNGKALQKDEIADKVTDKKISIDLNLTLLKYKDVKKLLKILFSNLETINIALKEEKQKEYNMYIIGKNKKAKIFKIEHLSVYLKFDNLRSKNE